MSASIVSFSPKTLLIVLNLRILKATTEKDAYSFVGYLTKGGLSATVRRLNGADIDGACGQLRRSFINVEKI